MSDDQTPQDNSSEEVPIQVPTPPDTDSQSDTTPLELIAQNFKQHKPVAAPGGGDVDPEQALTSLGLTMGQFEELAQRFPFLSEGVGKKENEWMRAIAEGRKMMTPSNRFVDSLGREESFWEQGLNLGDDKLLSMYKPTVGSKDSLLSGDAALFHVTNYLKIGAQVTVPLWHSGIWVTLKAPSDTALLELERRIGLEKVSLGRRTSGMVFSNHSVYTMSHLVNFIMMHILDSNVKMSNNQTLKDLILTTDLPSLYWGMASAIHPNGYPFKQPCTNDPNGCKQVYEALISIPKLQWVDRESLNTWQRKHMATRNQKVDPDTIKTYQRDMVRGGDKLVKVMDDADTTISLNLKVPTVSEYEDSGFQWVANIEAMTDKAFGNNLKGEDRDVYIQGVAHTTSLQMYGHWINKVTIGEDNGVDIPRVVEDPETINQMLGSVFSARDDIAANTMNKIGEYIDNATMSVIGIPKFHCPKCHRLVGEEDKVHEHILPIDMLTTFFTLLDQRLAKRFIEV